MAEALAIVGVVLTVPSVLEVCQHQYENLSTTLTDIRMADKELDKYFMFCDLSFSELEETYVLLYKLHSQSSLGVSLQNILVKVLLDLQKLLATFTSELNSCYEEGGDVKKIKFALVKKKRLNKYQKEIDEWNQRLTRRLLLRGLSMSVEPESRAESQKRTENSPDHGGVAQAPFAAPSVDAPVLPIPVDETLRRAGGSNAYVAKLPDDTVVLVEYRKFSKDAKFNEKLFIKHSVRDVATMLCNANMRLTLSRGTHLGGMLKCLGYFEDETRLRYGLASQLPPPHVFNSSPRSLDDLLHDPVNIKGSRHDLNDRIVLARSIASAVLEIHAAHFVHKSIRPSNILIFDPQEPETKGYPDVIGHPAIIGFEETRPDAQDSERIGSSVWEENIYRHPERQGLKLEVPYSMLHDIYSLGVIFTEIALWKSSRGVMIDQKTGVATACHNAEFWGSLYKKCQEDDPKEIQALYRKRAKSAVPKLIGGRFASVTDRCLTCLDGEFGANDEPDVAYMEKVMESLEGICL